MTVAGTATSGRTGLGATPPSMNSTLDTLAGLVFAYGSAMAVGNWTLASMVLSFFQDFWTNVSGQVKQNALAHGASSSALSAVPDDLVSDGMFGVNTSKVFVAVIAWDTGRNLTASAPTNAGGVALWFQREVEPLVVPASPLRVIWNSLKNVSMAALTGDVVSRVSLAFWNGTTAAGVDITTPPVDTTGPRPVTNPGTGTAPVPGGLPTVRQVTLPGQADIPGTKAVVPNWVYWTGGSIAIGAVIAVGYYMVKHRPELFKSRAKRRRR